LAALVILDVMFTPPLRIFLKIKDGKRGLLAVTATLVRGNKKGRKHNLHSLYLQNRAK